MAIPLAYNLRSVRERWTSAVVAVLGIAGTVGGLRGHARPGPRLPGDPDLVRLARATRWSGGRARHSEMDEHHAPRSGAAGRGRAGGRPRRGDAPRERRGRGRSPPSRSRQTGTDANVSASAACRRACSRSATGSTSSRAASSTPACPSWSWARARPTPTRGSTSARRSASAARTWTVVGVFDAGGSAFDSEVWCDADVLERHLPAAPRALPVGDRAPHLAGRVPRLPGRAPGRPPTHGAGRARDRLLAKQSRTVTTLILVLGSLVAAVMGAGRGVRRPQHDVLGGGRARARDRGAARARLR